MFRTKLRQGANTAKSAFRSHGGKLGAFICFVGLISPVAARSKTDSFDVLVPREKTETLWNLESITSPGRLLLRLCTLICNFFPVVFVSPLLWINNESINSWIYELLRERLSAAGPFFIKFGQWASTRYDLLPLHLCEELNRLTQDAPHHSWDETDNLLREEFIGDYRHSLQIDKKAFASGSVAQTYRGMLGDHLVAVKVQHPGIRETMETDIVIINQACAAADKLLGTCIQDIFSQFALHLHDQLDFRQEKGNLERFHDNFKLWRFVSFPKPYTASKKVLVESFEPGHSIIEYIRDQQNRGSRTDLVELESRKKLGSLGLAALLKMIISDNFVHADLHPGNILVRPAPAATNIFISIKQRIEAYMLGFRLMDDVPQVCLLDAGLTSAIHPRHMPDVEEFFKSMIDRDGERIAKSILALSAHHRPLSEAAQGRFIEKMKSKTSLTNETAWNLESRTGECMKDALNIVRESGIRVDTSVMVPLITTITLEGWQYELDPTISVLDHIRKQVSRHDFFVNLCTDIAHSMWKSSEYNTGLAETSPPSYVLADDWRRWRQRSFI